MEKIIKKAVIAEVDDKRVVLMIDTDNIPEEYMQLFKQYNTIDIHIPKP